MNDRPVLRPLQDSCSSRASRAVIGMARQYRRDPVKLFQKHDGNQLGRPGRGPKRQSKLLLGPQIGRKSVRTADNKSDMADRLVAKARQMPRQADTVDIVAAFVQAHNHGVLRDQRGDRSSLLGDPRRNVTRAAFGNFMDVEAAEPELAADLVETLAVAFGEL